VDETWKRQPTTFSETVRDQIADRIHEYTLKHRIPALSVVLHGGEPLLAGLTGVAATLKAVKEAVPPHTQLHFGIQTNGILLDERFLDLFHEYEVRVGVSLDGGRNAHNRHRIYANQRGSYDGTAAALRLLSKPEHRAIYSGLLCTIDVRNDPVEVYEDLLTFEPPAIDLLLPHGNWTNPPPRPAGARTYAEWLIDVFDAWYCAPRVGTRIRLFESMMVRMLGGRSANEAIGGDEPGVVVIETDGSYERTDSLRTTEEGAAATGLGVATHSLEDLISHLDVPSALAEDCLACPVLSICGGGLRAHRYRDGSFEHPSAYCADLYTVIRHIRDRVATDLGVRI
jgi:uncharacterized protein